MTKIRIGTSGFGYDDWLGNFYPQFCCKQDYLRFYGLKYNTVEIDATYYRIPAVETVKKWCKITPDNFIFTAKFPQHVTHEGDESARISTLHKFIETMKYMDCKLGPLMLQFPYSFKPEQQGLLFKILEELPNNYRFAIELRNKQWLKVDRLFELLSSKNIAFANIDHPWMPREELITADFIYIRLLGDRKKYPNDFSFVRNERLDDLIYWSKYLQKMDGSGKDCFAYINNHFTGNSPATANQLLEMIQQ